MPVWNGRTWVPLRGFQWLTDDAAWDQGWATRQSFDCDRTEVRFEVVIPKAHRGRLRLWDEVAGPAFHFSEAEQKRMRLLGGGDSSHWYLYGGCIPASWLRRLQERPADAPRPPAVPRLAAFTGLAGLTPLRAPSR